MKHLLYLLCLLPLLIGCKKAGTDDAGTIKIGALLPLEGTNSETGHGFQNGIRLAAREINQAGGVLGKTLEVVEYNNRSNSATSIQGAEYLISQGVLGIVGVASSSNVIAVAPTTATAGVPLISPSGTSPLITEFDKENGTNLLFRTSVSDSYTGRMTGWFANKYLGKKTASILYIDDTYGASLANNFAGAFESNGGQVITKVGFPKLTNVADIEAYDFSSLVSQVLGTPAELLFLVSFMDDGIAITTAINNYKISNPTAVMPSLLGCDANKKTRFIQNAPAAIIRDMHFILPFSSPYSVRNKIFEHNYNTFVLRQSTVIPYASNAYDATYLLALAIEQAGQEDAAAVAQQIVNVSKTGEKITVDDFALAKMLIASGTDIDYEGASSSVDMDEQGDVKDEMYLVSKIITLSNFPDSALERRIRTIALTDTVSFN